LQQAKLAKKAIAPTTPTHLEYEKKQAHVLQLINAYRLHGHHHALLDPLNMAERKHIPDLELSHHHLSDADLETIFSTESPLTQNGENLHEIITALKRTYCGSIGAEYMHITDTNETHWIIDRLESVQAHPQFTSEQQLNILKHLTAAEGLEKYLGLRYVGQKRFSLEGSDSLIPMLHELINRACAQQVKEVVLGMAHRGRLNVLVNVLGKAPEILFKEFEGKHSIEMSGDVKYHMGFSSDVCTPDGVVHLALAFNPSHLEIICPVVEGSVRSRQRRRGDLLDKKQVIPILIHGDAAFAGQGVVMETFNFSQARGYSTGGTVHIVINNQIGFTTSNPLDARSTLYCTDVAKMVQAPVFHVNADDPEAVIFIVQLAFDFRMRFKRDVVIDLVCYRRHGHNEADEPSVTQPLMYQAVRQVQTTRKIYADHLIRQGVLNQEQVDGFNYSYRDKLEKGEPIVETVIGGDYEDTHLVDWTPFLKREWAESVDTTVPLQRLKQLARRLEAVPSRFDVHTVVKRLWQERCKMTDGDLAVNWGYAEILAYATLMDQGYPVRLSGQDSGRGTFAHRHAVLHDYKTGELYIPLQHISRDQADFIIIDSVLSEEAVLGFEYGFAASEPNVLVIWEAQFGDFANGAQVVVDQFISSGEQKWGRLCGLVMLLPHGYEGQGPEHSSARLERYLQLCAQHNMQVCVPTTPAQIFHMLRRQMLRQFRKPLIVMTPKSLLRHKLAVSSLQDLAEGEFKLIIGEIDDINPAQVRKVVLCSGKVYYDLLAQRRKDDQQDVAIIRIEQLYPFPKEMLQQELTKYMQAKDVIWCQEEPQNQGAWYSSQHNMRACLGPEQNLHYAGRDHFAAPAVGYMPLHVEQQQKLIAEALGAE
ncbi:MAG: 2-oxoglutarate dehydrogenase E1 component, partial [Gammaproteobacteria bacterium]